MIGLIGQDQTDAVSGRRKSEDVERGRRFPVNKVRMDSVVEDPVVFIDPGASIEVIGSGVMIQYMWR